ncbi:hypothetical protein M0813_29781 [Anaeramoeba flamelloides]|uniref:Ribosome biogenesis protein RPF2 homolog n=1 Tax=Anaeramoeba flamelloides TaxID=1746091 RepID=A0AAV7Z9I0_9EUKA|nr:hypothetical protein M0812_16817 [Anaeramoeba flamelloides]KAJ6233476.1 hypothetical protein M0813_29781 [Anaeramoeba flamelloides]
MNKIISRTNIIPVNEKHFLVQENLTELKKFVKSIDSQIKILPKTTSSKVFVKSTPSTVSMNNLSVNEPQQCFLLKRNSHFDPQSYLKQKSFLQTKNELKNATFRSKRRQKYRSNKKKIIFNTEDTFLEDL